MTEQMSYRKLLQRRLSRTTDKFRRWGASIGTKIVLPYFLLTLVVASIGTFVITTLVTNSLQERFQNQLLDAGRVVSESMVRQEQERLRTLRAVTRTEGVPQNVAAADRQALKALVPQIIANSDTDAVELLDMDGIEIYGWQQLMDRPPDEALERDGTSFSEVEAVEQVLAGFVDEFGDKRVFLSETPGGLMIFTVGPVSYNGEQVGAAMVGTYLRRLMVDLTLNAVARVTLYDRNGRVIDTTLGGDKEEIAASFQASPEQYQEIVAQLQESPSHYQLVIAEADQEVTLQSVEVIGQRYVLAFGDWRLRGQSFGLFSVALPSNFIFTAATTSRNLISLIFALATVAVFTVGFLIARHIIRPLNQLVQTSIAVAEGDLEQRSDIDSRDEIGTLARSFNLMTERLAQRNQQLLQQASELEAILQSIADGVIVLDTDDRIITANSAAEQLLADMAIDFPTGPLRQLRPPTAGDQPSDLQSLTSSALQEPQRYQIGNRTLSALAAPVETPEGARLGTVVILRDVTREAEAENLKDAFITSISHELRTPLTVIKVYTDLMLKTANGHLDERQLRFMNNIDRGSAQLERHINQLINISEIQAGTINLEKEQIDFPALVQEVVDPWRERLESKGLKLELSLPQKKLRVFVDPNHLSWAIENVLSNAYNYTQEGRVEVHVYEQDGEVRVDVTDTGIGIAAADIPHLFDRFFRAENAENFDVRGVGLGLFLTRSIVEMHAGRVSVHSELGVGTTLRIALPLNEQIREDKLASH